MPRRGRSTAELVLNDEERATLRRWARRPTSMPALALRCRIVLACAKGDTNTKVADRLGVSSPTVGKWRRRFIERGVEGLHDRARSGAPRRISDDEVERVIVKTLQESPAGATGWSTRSMAQATGMSQSTISRLWRTFGLQPQLPRARPGDDPGRVRLPSTRAPESAQHPTPGD